MSGRLESDVALSAELRAVLASSADAAGTQEWFRRLATFLAEVRVGIPAKLQDEDFLRCLWDANPVAATGAGTVRMDAALADVGFRSWFAAEVAGPLPAEPAEISKRLVALYDELTSRLGALCRSTPRLKIHRVLCALYPTYFTSIVNEGKLRYLHRELGGSVADHPVEAHLAIRSRLDATLAPMTPGNDLEAARRVCMPWLLYTRLVDEKPDATGADAVTPEALLPLPLARRRKGLTALKGSFQSLLDYVEELRDGLTREEFVGLIKAANPSLADNSINATMNVVSREFDLCRKEGDTFRLTARGLELRATRDPDVFADLLLTRVVGVDHVLTRLRANSCTKGELIALLKRVHPGWTSDFAPGSLVNWLIALDLIPAGWGPAALTERGRRWAEMVTWEPEFPAAIDPPPATEPGEPSTGCLQLPTPGEIRERAAGSASGRGLTFDPRVLDQLHAALWFHPVRHFAVLCGISGSGKTQLALHYAYALTATTPGEDNDRVRVIPVQPGWYDPVPLLGYVSPLKEDTYRSAPFLELLLRAADDPGRPYVAILDEMNLSHPEQYFAPLLSAMETHGWLDLHDLGEDVAGVPGRLRYPANLALLGTLNMDETTHGLSDKVLDRAYILEFWKIDIDAYPHWDATQLPAPTRDRVRELLRNLARKLSPVRLHFGWRVVDDIVRCLEFQHAHGGDIAAALDDLVYAKILPKLRGDGSGAFREVLGGMIAVLDGDRLVRSAEKVKALLADLETTGSARFWR